MRRDLAPILLVFLVGCFAPAPGDGRDPHDPPGNGGDDDDASGDDDTGPPTDDDDSTADDDSTGDDDDSTGPPPDDDDTGSGNGIPGNWPSGLAPWAHNPVLVATSTVELQGEDNVYAPDIVEVGGVSVMFYGAQAADGHDAIHVAYSTDGAEWRKWPEDANPLPVVAHGGSNHVNDPSVVFANGLWHMYYTDAPTAEDDEVWLATSPDLLNFTKQGPVLLPGGPGAWNDVKVGRPAALFDGQTFHLWYDGTGPTGRHVGYATSADGQNFTPYAGNPVLLHAGAVDVELVDGVFVMVREAGDGTYWATSLDGISWTDQGKLFGLSGQAYDAHGQVTPFLEVHGGAVTAIWFGGASVPTWNRNRVAVAYPSGGQPAGGGCTACTSPGVSCPESCHGAGQSSGSCGAPGSTDPGGCCACFSEGCDACLVAAMDCHEACVAADNLGGYCAYPGSQDPSQCCACVH